MSIFNTMTFSGKKCRLASMIMLTVIFFFVEVIGGCITNSTALTADSFHMLTDIAALLISFMSAKMTKRKWKRNTFGWARAEILGALVNAVFLIAMCVTIIIQACKHFSEGSRIQEPKSLVIVGILGLIVNLIGLCLLYKYGVGHGHSHGSDGIQKNPIQPETQLSRLSVLDNISDIETIDFEKGKDENSYSRKSKRSNCNKTRDLNMRGAFLHVLCDALGSVIVIISALVVWKTEWKFRFYFDPVLSLLLVCLILRPAWPLLRESSLILLQSVPRHINIDDLRKRLLSLEGVLAVHEFHVWQLTGDRIIATAHIHCENLAEYMSTAERVKEFFHHEGIHSTTIQPEFFQLEEILDNSAEISVVDTEFCALSCPVTDKEDCFKATCCQIKHKKLVQN